MTEINKQFGFYGTMHNRFNTDETKRIWDLMVKKMKEIYPKKSEDEIIAFLNAKTGRHIADELLSTPEGITFAVLMVRIAVLNKIKMAAWWAYHHGLPMKTFVDKRQLYKSAIKNEMHKKAVKKIMIEMIGCALDQVWTTPEMWLESDYTTTEELKLMWGYIQDKITKEKKDGH